MDRMQQEFRATDHLRLAAERQVSAQKQVSDLLAVRVRGVGSDGVDEEWGWWR